jgi:hypothetical protein
MGSTSRFRVVSAFAAMEDHHGRRYVTIPAGSVVETSDDLDQPGFIHVNVDGNTFVAFKRDIKERTQLIERTGATDRLGSAHSWHE